MPKIAFFSAKPYDQDAFQKIASDFSFTIHYFETQLNSSTAKLAEGFDAVCIFVNDDASTATIEVLHRVGVKIIALRCAGFNNVDLEAASRYSMTVARVPAYSPEAVAEHTLGLMLTLNRKIHRAYARTKEGNFSLNGLEGFTMKGKVIGIIGTGKIGLSTIRVLSGLQVKMLAYDPYPNEMAKSFGVEYTDLATIYQSSDIISLHCPLTQSNHHLLNWDAFARMKDGVMIINTSRGALIHTLDVIEALKRGRIGALGLDVYEEEEGLFFRDNSDSIIADDLFRQLASFPNVLFTGHQAFLTSEALNSIANTTLSNLQNLIDGNECQNIVSL